MNQNFVIFLKKQYNIVATEKINIPLTNLLEIYNEFLQQFREEKEEEHKTSKEILDKKERLNNLLQTQAKLIEEDRKISEEKREEEKKLNVINIELKESKKKSAQIEKGNFLLKTDLLNTIKAKNALVHTIQNDNKTYQELLKSFHSNITIYE
jgi:hypothetical protein